jgi:hypothetical protein
MPNVNIFISYRRDDAAGHAGRLCDRLDEHFRGCVFMDVTGIAPGANFVRALEHKLASCQVLIVVIGKSWLSITNERVGRAEPDHARIEVATALRSKGVTVIPVLVQGARMPSPGQLPPDLRPLADHHALEITEPDFRDDVRRLAHVIGKLYVPEQPQRPRPDPTFLTQPPPSTGIPLWIKLFVGLGAAGAVGVFAIFMIFGAVMSAAEAEQSANYGVAAGGQALVSPPPAPTTAPRKNVKAPAAQPEANDFSPAGTWLVTLQTASGPLTATYYLYPNNQMEFSGGAFAGSGTWDYDYAKSTLVISGTNNYDADFQLVLGIGARQGGAYQLTSAYGPGTMVRSE